MRNSGIKQLPWQGEVLLWGGLLPVCIATFTYEAVLAGAGKVVIDLHHCRFSEDDKTPFPGTPEQMYEKIKQRRFYLEEGLRSYPDQS